MSRNGFHPPAKQGIPLQRASGLIMIANTPKGRGVFASQSIPSGTVIDVCPVLIISPDEVAHHTSQTCLDHYTYNWPSRTSRSQALALGTGSLFNHSGLGQNVGWKRDIPNTSIIYTAIRDIAAGDELCISYGELWFEDADDEAEYSEEEGRIDEGRMEAVKNQVMEKGKAELVVSGLGRIALDFKKSDGDGDDETYGSQDDADGRRANVQN